VVAVALEPFNADIADDVSTEAERELAVVTDRLEKNAETFADETRTSIEGKVIEKEEGNNRIGKETVRDTEKRTEKVQKEVEKGLEKAEVEGVIQVFVDTSYWQGPTSLYIAETGNIGVGTESPEYALHVAGSVAGEQLLVTLESNENVEDVRTVGEGENFLLLDQLREAKVSRYTTTATDGSTVERFGFLKEDAPSEILSTDGNAIDLERFAGFTVATMKAMLTKQANLEERVANLELIGGVSSGSVGDASGSLLAQLGASIYNGVLSFKSLIVENLTVGSPGAPSGITMFDEETGEPYCLIVSGGETITRAGVCEEEEPDPDPTPEPEPDPEPTSEPNSDPVEEDPLPAPEPVEDETGSEGGGAIPSAEEVVDDSSMAPAEEGAITDEEDTTTSAGDVSTTIE
jgi:hypothetical protein